MKWGPGGPARRRREKTAPARPSAAALAPAGRITQSSPAHGESRDQTVNGREQVVNARPGAPERGVRVRAFRSAAPT